MSNIINRLRDREDGFTLIELLVVILIIGILAAIALPNFLGQTKKAQDTSSKTTLSTVTKAVKSIQATNDTQSRPDAADVDGTGVGTINEAEPNLTVTDESAVGVTNAATFCATLPANGPAEAVAVADIGTDLWLGSEAASGNAFYTVIAANGTVGTAITACP